MMKSIIKKIQGLDGARCYDKNIETLERWMGRGGTVKSSRLIL